MWPRIGPIPTYGVFYFVGIVIYFIVSRHIARRYHLKRRVWLAISLSYLVGMTLGAKLLYDLGHPPVDVWALFRAEHYIHGGLWGGLLAYFVLAVSAVLLLSRQRRPALDLVAASIPLPWIAAKLACLLNGCCYGLPCLWPWAITFPEGARGAPAGVPLHPTQVYEIAVMVILLLVFARLKSERWQGTKLLWFLTIYGLGRAATDIFRGDNEHYLLSGWLTMTQALCLAAALAAILALVALQRVVRVSDGSSELKEKGLSYR